MSHNSIYICDFKKQQQVESLTPEKLARSSLLWETDVSGFGPWNQFAEHLLADAGIEKIGEFIYEAQLAEPATAPGYLHIEIKFFDSTWPLDFALFAGE